jgi:hypothetical protein
MKTEVYSWRVSSSRKSELEAEARRNDTSVAQLLERIAADWLQTQRTSRVDEDREQQRIRAAASLAIGSFASDDPNLSKNVSRLVREGLIERDASRRSR